MDPNVTHFACICFRSCIYDICFAPLVGIRNTQHRQMNMTSPRRYKTWGADRTTFLKLYRSLVWSKLDYGCIIYGSARLYMEAD